MTESVDPNQFLKKWSVRFLKVIVLVSIVLAFYVIYMDAWVQTRMTGQKWETPVKVFARPLTLYQHKFLPKNELVAELKILSYRQVDNAVEPGQYSVSGQTVEVYRRGFIYVDDQLEPKKLKVEFSDDRIVSAQREQDGQWLLSSIESLDPLLISRKTNSKNEDRDIINLATVPEWMIDTLLVVEDKNFYHHHGVSPFAILRALWANLVAGRKVQGGSTLTQQLAKNLLLNDNRKTYLRKFKEAITALILDYRFSKDDILEAYFNEIYLGQNGSRAVHGFALASKFYFSKPLVELQQHEFALLIAIVKGPSYYNPTRHVERAKKRRDLVLQLMVSENVIDSAEYEKYIVKPMVIRQQKTKGRELYPAYMQLVERELKELEVDEYSANGLLVFTGLDPVLQKNYQKLFGRSVRKLENKYSLKDINGAVVSIDNSNASIMALVGDKNPNSFGFNRALDANRNIGSLVKPVIYLTALQSKKYNFASVLSNKALAMKNNQGDQWQPQNYDKTTSESVLLQQGLVNSINLPTVHLGLELGLDKVISTLNSLGVEQNIPKYPSILLGAVPMSPLNVAKMLQPIASYGQKLTSSAILDVTDVNGFSIWSKSKDVTEVADYSTSYLLNEGLKQVTEVGTGKRLGMYYPHVQYAGKTGTTDDSRDSWFMGFDQNKLTTIWIGKDDNSPVKLTGSQGAVTIFLDLQAARKAESIVTPKPNDIDVYPVDLNTGEILSGECGDYILLPIRKAEVASKSDQIKECPSFFDFLK
ncbi:penicillin-binding protein 1B [uncultured Psychrosphaera sp.]|uniref:penicillin-binding protein 1B n=1 Tax=uncultured Psychrosphaera sp. TaxID=1403522 RepID=UPI00261D36CA|nr:penicillin-binding protein 1B [uncultured Psychrosphaera sp.]